MNLAIEKKLMLRALKVSKRALPDCQPNPPVGCILAIGEKIVAEGFTQSIGGDHAEVTALKAYSGSMDGVTAYVTLEPCSFVGRTPACAETLAEAGIRRAVVAMLDPDPRNNGQGISLLERRGIEVIVGIASDEVSEFLSPYLGLS
ncbi:bifunctional diaminohydroxyphosphoribosylaminopyrimidine deaminase/5-amino-6-(5-phosphoribosylamino)uracil reductase RibD [Vibrio lamellibrachiae]|uniref:bifunctional diaminohydroxyphosphoribosylaminopyrimidine deaminase/5-amino-6-(5-phosphoribosylamino)uracil reductase RibD n=1 Tax=Vibrio lamellibrachiae TaxID=2910253 RepID=UPI003D0C876E